MDYAKTQSKVATKLGKVGMELGITVSGNSDYVAAADTFSTVAEETYTVYGIKRSYTDKEITSGFLGQEKSKNLIQVGDVEFMISVNSSLPALNDEQNIKITEGTVDWSVVRVKAVAPAGTVLFYKLHATRRDDLTD